MNIKQATTGDLTALSQLFDEYRIFYRKESDVLQAQNFLRERIENKESVIFVALNDENIMTGFVQLYPLFSSTRMKRLWLLNDLYVNSKYRGQGISKGLINKAKELVRATNAAALTLETGKNNTIGNRLYDTTGFELDEEHNYYSWSNG